MSEAFNGLPWLDGFIELIWHGTKHDRLNSNLQLTQIKAMLLKLALYTHYQRGENYKSYREKIMIYIN